MIRETILWLKQTKRRVRSNNETKMLDLTNHQIYNNDRNDKSIKYYDYSKLNYGYD